MTKSEPLLLVILSDSEESPQETLRAKALRVTKKRSFWASFILSFWGSVSDRRIPYLYYLYSIKPVIKIPRGFTPSEWQKRRRPFGLRLRVTIKKVKVKKRVTEKASFWTERKRSEKSRRPFGLRLRVTMWWSFWPWAEALSLCEGAAKGKNPLLVSPQWFFNYRIPSLITALCCVYPLIIQDELKKSLFYRQFQDTKFFLDKDIIFCGIKMRLAENL